jgi:hypothetical protein
MILLIKRLLKEELKNYHGEHQAPDKEDIPIYNMTLSYPEDIYSSDAAKLYGDHSDEYSDQYSLTVIKSVRNKPKAKVKIYRAVPDINYEFNKELKDLNYIISYYYKFGFFQMKNKFIHDLDNKYYEQVPSYEKRQAKILSDIESERDAIIAKKHKLIGINNGDWVTINPDYAKSHGRNNLNNRFKIVTKTVPANTLFTFGDSIHEWGFNI